MDEHLVEDHPSPQPPRVAGDQIPIADDALVEALEGVDRLLEDLERVRRWTIEQGLPAKASDEMILTVLRGWTELFGCISMELFGHYVGSIENGPEFLDELAHRSFHELQELARP